MKINANQFIVYLICLLSVSISFAAPGPPPPTHKRPPPPPGLPIDENVYMILLFSILFGMYIIYRHTLKTKTPM